jgi:hypothetical protein
MKFYLENAIPFTGLRRAHILKDEKPTGKCWCKANLGPQRWTIVEALPEDIHLCITL